MFLICKYFVTIGKIDDAAIGKAMLLDVVSHDYVVTMGVDADVVIIGKAEVHDAAEDTMYIRQTGYAMNYMIGLLVVLPIAIIYL